MIRLKLELALIRHGQLGSAARRLIGVTDEPLGEAGEALLRSKSASGAYPEVQMLFSSGLSRCMETSYIIYPNIPVVALRELCAPNYGDFDGKTYSELNNDERFARWCGSVGIEACPNGEEPYALLVRSAAVFARIVDETAGKGLERAAIVTHRLIIQSILNRYCVPRPNYADWDIQPGGGYLVSYDTVNGRLGLLSGI